MFCALWWFFWPILCESLSNYEIAECQMLSSYRGGGSEGVVRISASRGSCDTPRCYCEVEIEGVTRLLSVQYPWYSYENNAQLIGFSPSHTLYQTAKVQTINDFGTDILAQDVDDFLTELPYPSYLKQGVGVAYNMEDNFTYFDQGAEAEELQQNQSVGVFQENDEVIAPFLTSTRRRFAQRRRLQTSQERSRMEAMYDALTFFENAWKRKKEDLFETNTRRKLTQSSSLFTDLQETCEIFVSNTNAIREASVSLTNTFLGLNDSLTELNRTELAEYQLQDFQNCMNKNYQSISGICLGLEDCEDNLVARLELDLRVREQSIYQNEMVAIRTSIELIQETRAGSLDFEEEFINQTELILSISKDVANASEGLEAIFSLVEETQDDLYEAAEQYSSIYSLFSEGFEKELVREKANLEEFRNNLLQIEVAQTNSYRLLSEFLEGADETINRNYLYLVRLLKKGKTMTNVWKNLLKLVDKIMDGSATKPYLTSALSELHSESLLRGWRAMFLRPPSPPLLLTSNLSNTQNQSIVTPLHTWEFHTFETNHSFRVHKVTLWCDVVKLTFGDNSFSSYNQLLFLFAPQSCTPFEDCICFLETMSYTSTTNIQQKLALMLALQLPLRFANNTSFEKILRRETSSIEGFLFNIGTENASTFLPEQEHTFILESLSFDREVLKLWGLNEDVPSSYESTYTSSSEDVLHTLRGISNCNRTRTKKNWFYDGICLLSDLERRNQIEQTLDFWSRSIVVSSNETQVFLEELYNVLHHECTHRLSYDPDPWSNSTSLPYGNKAYVENNTFFWGPGLGYEGLLVEYRAGSFPEQKLRPRFFFTPEMFLAQSGKQDKLEIKEKICSTNFTDVDTWGDPLLSNPWGLWREEVREQENTSSLSDMKLLGAETLSEIKLPVNVFWNAFRQTIIPLMTSVQSEVYDLAQGRLPFPLHTESSRSHLSTAYRDTEEPPRDPFQSFFKGGDADELVFSNEEIVMAQTEKASFLSISQDATPIWELQGLKTHLSATMDGAITKQVYLLEHVETPPEDMVWAGYWSCLSMSCPYRVNRLAKNSGRIRGYDSFRSNERQYQQAQAPTLEYLNNLTAQEFLETLLNTTFFEGRYTDAEPTDGLYPYIIDITQDIAHIVHEDTFENRAGSPLYLFRKEDNASKANLLRTDKRYGTVFREATKPLGTYTFETQGEFHPQDGRQSLGQRIARLVVQEPDWYGPKGEAFRISSLEKNCLTAKSIGGLCSLLSFFYTGTQQYSGEVGTSGSGTFLRFYPRRWTQEVMLTFSSPSEEEMPNTITTSPYQQLCPLFKIEQQQEAWKVVVVPKDVYPGVTYTLYNFQEPPCNLQEEVGLMLPEPFSSKTWAIPFCSTVARLEIRAERTNNLQGQNQSAVCRSFRAEQNEKRNKPLLELGRINSRALVLRRRDSLAKAVQELGVIISDALYASNNWTELQLKLGTWVSEAPIANSSAGALAEELNQPIKEMEAYIKENIAERQELEDAWETYVDLYLENKQNLEELRLLHAEALSYYEFFYKGASEELADLEDYLKAAYNRYNESSLFEFFFADLQSNTYEVLLQWIIDEQCVMDATTTEKDLVAFYIEESGGCKFNLLGCSTRAQIVGSVSLWAFIAAAITIGLYSLITFFL